MGALYQFELCIECILGPASTRTLQSRFSFPRGCSSSTARPAAGSPGGGEGAEEVGEGGGQGHLQEEAVQGTPVGA